MLATSWNRTIDTREALKRLQKNLWKWNWEVFGDVQVRKGRLFEEIKVVQDILDQHQTDVLLRKEGELVGELDVVLEQEELIWFQKSREKWVVHGYRNTKFFHTSTMIRRKINRIERLKEKKEDGLLRHKSWRNWQWIILGGCIHLRL